MLSAEEVGTNMTNKGQIIHMQDSAKHIVDTVAATTTLGAFFDMLPNMVTLLTGIWICIRIWETDTVQSIIDKFRGNKE